MQNNVIKIHLFNQSYLIGYFPSHYIILLNKDFFNSFFQTSRKRNRRACPGGLGGTLYAGRDQEPTEEKRHAATCKFFWLSPTSLSKSRKKEEDEQMAVRTLRKRHQIQAFIKIQSEHIFLL